MSEMKERNLKSLRNVNFMNFKERNFTSNDLVTSQLLTDADEIGMGLTSFRISDAAAVLFLSSEVVLAVNIAG